MDNCASVSGAADAHSTSSTTSAANCARSAAKCVGAGWQCLACKNALLVEMALLIGDDSDLADANDAERTPQYGDPHERRLDDAAVPRVHWLRWRHSTPCVVPTR